MHRTPAMKRVLSCAAAVIVAACGSDKSTGPKQVTPPVVDSISPKVGTVGTEVRVYGRAFAADSVAVYFNALRSPRVQQQNGSVFAVAPEGLQAGATYDIRVVNRNGGADTLAAAFQAV